MGAGKVSSVDIMQLIAKAQQDKMPAGSTAELTESDSQESAEFMTPGSVPSVSATAKPVGY